MTDQPDDEPSPRIGFTPFLLVLAFLALLFGPKACDHYWPAGIHCDSDSTANIARDC